MLGDPPAKPWPHCWVYFITDGVAIKIGKTGSVNSRITNLQTSHYAELRELDSFCGTGDDEEALHEHFKALRLRGEWFKDDPKIHAMMRLFEKRREQLDLSTTTIRAIIKEVESRPIERRPYVPLPVNAKTIQWAKWQRQANHRHWQHLPAAMRADLDGLAAMTIPMGL